MVSSRTCQVVSQTRLQELITSQVPPVLAGSSGLHHFCNMVRPERLKPAAAPCSLVATAC